MKKTANTFLYPIIKFIPLSHIEKLESSDNSLHNTVIIMEHIIILNL